MKKTLIAIAMAGSSLVGINAHAYDGQVHFTGNITADACTVNDGSGDPIEVALGTVSQSSFTADGDKSDPTKFSIALTECPATLTSASIKFDGTADANNGNVLALDSDSTGKGVGIEISEADGTQLPLYTASKAVTITSGAANFDFIGRYIATDYANLAAGTANGTSDFTVAYN